MSFLQCSISLGSPALLLNFTFADGDAKIWLRARILEEYAAHYKFLWLKTIDNVIVSNYPIKD